MTRQEKIQLATQEVIQAEILIKSSRISLKDWENKLDLRRETLERLKASK